MRFTATDYTTSGASMGPRFCKRGNAMLVKYERPAVPALQGGHAFVSVETEVVGDHEQLPAHASMGPRFCKRGNRLGVLLAI